MVTVSASRCAHEQVTGRMVSLGQAYEGLRRMFLWVASVLQSAQRVDYQWTDVTLQTADNDDQVSL